MLHARIAIAIAGVALCTAPAAHAEERRFSIPAGTLGSAIVLLGQQADLTIGINDPAIASIRTRAVSGVMSPRAALDRLLARTGYTYVFVDARSVRIIHAPAVRAAPQQPRRQTGTGVAGGPAAPPEIVVTASKNGTPLSHYPGTAMILDLNDARSARNASQGAEAIVDRLPMLSSTSLGPGRDKLFVRGVADSSFNGPSQATVGQYLGEVRLNYSAPDPDLSLYDIGRVEVLEGPQGTLYGTGPLGGIIRLIPNPPDLRDVSGSLAAGVIATGRKGSGGDVAAVLNLPVAEDRLGVRAVAYRAGNPGYIDDVGRGLANVNRATTTGGRIATRLAAGNNWTFDFGGAVQTIDVRDGQYAEANLPPLTRRSRIAQPFHNHYGLAYATASKAWGAITLISTSSYVNHAIDTTYDATGFPGTSGAVRFDETVATTLLSHETRMNGRSEAANWVAGFSVFHSIDRLRRRLGNPAAPLPIVGVRNEATEAALFGQVTRRVSPRLSVTLGGRFNFARAVGEPLNSPVPEAAEPRRSSFVALPMIGLSWQAHDALIMFAQVQQGYRPGGLAIAESGSASETRRFNADRITTLEAGLRFGRPQHDSLWGNVTASFARWVDIQSDLVDATGMPFTTNIGDGRIFGLEGQINGRVSPDFVVDGAFFLNKSQLDRPAPLYAAALDRELPSIAEVGARAGFRYRLALRRDLALTLDGSARYVGKSNLGIGPLLGLDQGGYTDISVGSRLDLGRFGVSFDVRNLGDVRSNRFAFGNPFSIASGNQVTPLMPRTVRIGIDAKF